MLIASASRRTALPFAEAIRQALAEFPTTALMLSLGLCAVPMSIAVCEVFLSAALIFRLAAIARDRSQLRVPSIFWFWLPVAVWELAIWLRSTDLNAGQGEIRHLLLIATLFLILPSINQTQHAVTVWRAIFASATLCSLVLIVDFASRLIRFHREIAASDDPSFYLRSGGLLNHWMIYGTVEIMVFAALLEYWRSYPEHWKPLLPVFAVQFFAIILSLTRMLWVGCLLLLVLHLAWRRSKWILAAPVVPAMVYVLAPGPLHVRVATALQPSYYSNAERIQMLRVGAQMIREHPLTGVGAGRVDALYRSYLSPHDPVPTYHGHLHNNLFQLAAQFGLPGAFLAAFFLAMLLKRLWDRSKSGADREDLFLCRTALLGTTGFLAAGMFDYTYGHSLGLILLSFVAITPLAVNGECQVASPIPGRFNSIACLDRIAGGVLFTASLPVLTGAALITCILSRRSPFIAHLRVGRNGDRFWVWKLRTMWPREQAELPGELGWVQRIDCEPPAAIKPEDDRRVTSRFARFCRHYSIDELPQLFQVLRGDMSLVGPRPLTPGELARHYGVKAQEILSLKPGLTGYWQTQGRNSLSYAERVDLDLQLARDLSAALYLQLLFRTVPQVLRGKNAW
jgi:lipopolysaccharide/colanic/teichoic acid biosynthesis glycosyltransferase/O-antigen ligase